MSKASLSPVILPSCRTAELSLAHFLCNFTAYIPVRWYTLFSYIRTTIGTEISDTSIDKRTVDFTDRMTTAILLKNYHTVQQ